MELRFLTGQRTHHKVVDDAMEARSVEGKPIDALEANLAEVSDGFRGVFAEQSHNDSSQRRSAMSHVEINLRCHFKVSAVLREWRNYANLFGIYSILCKNLRLHRSPKLRQTERCSRRFSFSRLSRLKMLPRVLREAEAKQTCRKLPQET